MRSKSTTSAPLVDRICRTCGVAFQAPAHKVAAGLGIYCSRACYHARFGTPEERFWSHVVKTDGCWEWAGGKTGIGYGIFRAGGRHEAKKAHRFSWELHHGPIPDGLCVLHRCDRPHCTNPAHLWLGTQDDNIADRVRKGRSATGDRTRPETRLRGIDHVRAKLTEDQVREIRALYAAGGTSYRKLAALYGVSNPSIGDILRGKSWRHLL